MVTALEEVQTICATHEAHISRGLKVIVGLPARGIIDVLYSTVRVVHYAWQCVLLTSLVREYLLPLFPWKVAGLCPPGILTPELLQIVREREVIEKVFCIPL